VLYNDHCTGFNCVLHVHAAIEEVTFAALLHKLQKGTGRKSKLPPSHAKKGESIIARMEVIGGAGSVCIERFEDYPQMGRFTLRDQVSEVKRRILTFCQLTTYTRVKPSLLAR
jgi:translation elongation factor EF-1alpha